MVIVDQDVVLENLRELEEGQRGNYINPSDYGSLQASQIKCLDIMHFNIRSANKNFDEFLALIEAYKLTSCDVFVLSECFRNVCADNLNVPGYVTIYNGGDLNKNDGVLVVIKSDLNYTISNQKLIMCGVTLSIVNLIIGGVSFRIVALYRPNPSNLISFIDELDEYLDNARDNNTVELLIGDININLMNENDINVGRYFSVLAKHGFVPYILNPTRITAETESCLDHIFLKRSTNGRRALSFNSYILRCHITDHYPVLLKVGFKASKNIESKVNTKIVQKIDFKKLETLLKNENWNGIVDSDDPQIATDLFLSKFSRIIETAKIYKTKFKKNMKIKPWITEGLVVSIKNRDKLKKRLSQHFSTELEHEYKSYRNELNKLLKKSKNNFYLLWTNRL